MRTLLCWLVLSASAAAQNILLKDGRVIAGKSIRRMGDQIMATVVLPGGDNTKTGEFGYPLATVARLDFPEPPVLDAVPDLIVQGKAADALSRLEPVVTFFAGFRDAPGSFWGEAVMLKVHALLALGRTKDATTVLEQVSRDASDPETLRAAEVQRALVSGDVSPRALETASRALKECKRPAGLAAASLLKGFSLLAQKQPDAALLAFLQVPVFYPLEKNFLAPSLLGSGRAYFAIEDFSSARTALEEVVNNYSPLPEAELAKAELERLTRREKALAPPR